MKNYLILFLTFLLQSILFTQVDTLWTNRFNGTFNSADIVTHMAVDKMGNCYVTGSSADTDGEKITTIKYLPSGEISWIAKFHPDIYGNRRAYGIAVDDSMNVYVTGYSSSLSLPSTCITIKYDSSGQEKWFKYFGPYMGEARAITVDKQFNIYITGFCQFGNLGFDYVTVKYNSCGDQLWYARYTNSVYGFDIPSSIAVDDNGNVYVTGTSYDSTTYFDILTVKYNSSGQQEWVHRFDDPGLAGSKDDGANDIAVDKSGNIVVTGGIKGTAILGLPPNSFLDCITIKYDTNGDTLWVRKYDGGFGHDWAVDMSLDSNNNIYITGTTQGPYGPDYLTIKYNNEGQLIWNKYYNGLSYSSEDDAKSIALDNSGNVYITGSSGITGIYWNFATLKYNPDGEEQWAIRYGDDNYPTYHRAIAIGVDKQNNVFVTGQSRGDGTDVDLLTIKYQQDSTSSVYNEQITPSKFYLFQNYPNPFNPSTKIRYSIPNVGSGLDLTVLKIYDVLGNEVATLVNEYKSAGNYEVEFNVANESIRTIASGVYFYQLKAGNYIQTKKMILLN